MATNAELSSPVPWPLCPVLWLYTSLRGRSFFYKQFTALLNGCAWNQLFCVVGPCLVWGVFVLFVSHFLKRIILRRMRSHQRPSFLRCRHCYYVSLFPIELVRLARLLLVFRLALNALQSRDVSTLRLFCLQVLATRSLGWQ